MSAAYGDPRDPNVLARQCADLRDELDTEREAHQRTRDLIAILEHDRHELIDLLEKATGQEWSPGA